MSAPHEKLPLWRQAARLTEAVYATTARFPDSEKSGLSGSMRKAAADLAAEIAALSACDDAQPILTGLREQQRTVCRLQSHLALARRMGFVRRGPARRLARHFRRYDAALDLECQALQQILDTPAEDPKLRLAA